MTPFMLLSGCGGGGGDSSTPAPTPVNPALSISDASVLEGDSGNTSLQFTVTATVPTGSTAASASVSFATADGSATEGVDYVGANGTLQFPSGTTEATISIDVVGDLDIEVDETFTVTLSSPVNASITQASATGTIRDDDA